VHVLFVCWHNAARSQMAQAFFEQLADGPHTAASAGTHAGTDLNPIVVEVMREVGLDLSDRKPRQLTPELVDEADVIVRILSPDPDEWPWPPSKSSLAWHIRVPADPDTRDAGEIRALRDRIRKQVAQLVSTIA
jgi:arsenate reductase (thioredoxin)